MGQGAGRILIVDDEPSLLKMMSAYLARRGFTVITSNSTEKAWAQVEAAPGEFAAAVLDATMPGMSAQDLALRMLGANPSVRVIACSGYPVDMSAMEAAAPDRVMFLHKPFTAEMLMTAVRRILAREKEEV